MDQNNSNSINEHQKSTVNSFNPNGKPRNKNLAVPNRPRRDDSKFFQDTFPDSELGKVLKGLVVEFLIKQEHRMGWARKSACDDSELLLHPNETVASHMWGVAKLIMVLSQTNKFQEEMPHFQVLEAIKMALIHDVAELVTGDYTPVDSITIEEKHEKERKAMIDILGCFPKQINKSLSDTYAAYEKRDSIEAKFVKDCDKLDFIITAFILERQGFSGFEEFYDNTKSYGFKTKIAGEIADLLIMKRNELYEKNLLF